MTQEIVFLSTMSLAGKSTIVKISFKWEHYAKKLQRGNCDPAMKIPILWWDYSSQWGLYKRFMAYLIYIFKINHNSNIIFDSLKSDFYKGIGAL